MKIEWLVANATPVGSPHRAEHVILVVISDVFWPVKAVLAEKEPHCYVGILS